MLKNSEGVLENVEGDGGMMHLKMWKGIGA